MHAKLQPRACARAVPVVGVLLLAATGALGSARADQDDDAERVPSGAADIYSPIQRTFTHQAPLPGGPQRFVPGTSLPADDGPVLFQDLKERLRFADPFFRDMKLAVYLRTHDLDRDNASGPRSRAWAGGSALAIKTGFLDDWLQLEAAGATSQPLFAPEDEGGTLLLTQNQAEVSSFAIANARIRFTGQEVVLGRQLIKTPYINPQDNRMLPNTVEGAVLTRRRDEAQTFDYGVGYLWGFKARDSSYFVPFSEELGVTRGSRRPCRRCQGGSDRRPHHRCHRLSDRRRAQHDVRRSWTGSSSRAAAVPVQRQLHRSADGGRRSHRRCAVRDRSGVGPLRRQLRQRDAARGRLAERRRRRVAGPVRQLPGLHGARPAQLQRGRPENGRGRWRRLRPIASRARRSEAADPLRVGVGRRRCAERVAADPPERVQRRAGVPADIGAVARIFTCRCSIRWWSCRTTRRAKRSSRRCAASSPTSFPCYSGRMSSPAHNADPLRPFDARMLSVGDGHWLYVEEVGAADGIPAMFLHGGPGSGIAAPAPAAVRSCALPRLPVRSARRRAQPSLSVARRQHDAAPHRRHRGDPRSTSASSAGSSSAARGARRSPSPMREAHPERVTGLVLRAIFLGTRAEVEWAFVDGPKLFRPDLYADFVELLPEAERADPLAAYLRRLADTDPAVQVPAAQTWAAYERALSELTPSHDAADARCRAQRALAADADCRRSLHPQRLLPGDRISCCARRTA